MNDDSLRQMILEEISAKRVFAGISFRIDFWKYV